MFFFGLCLVFLEETNRKLTWARTPLSTPTEPHHVPLTLFTSKFLCGLTSAWTSIRSTMVRVTLSSVIFIVELQEGKSPDWTKTAGARWSQDTKLRPPGGLANQRRGRARTKSLFIERWVSVENKELCAHLHTRAKVCAPWELQFVATNLFLYYYKHY